MRYLKIIFVFIVTLAAAKVTIAQTTDADTVCVGATGVQYYVTSTVGSTYAWSIPGGGGIIMSGQGTSSITVDWALTTGNDLVRVIETNTGLCVGDPVEVAVTRVAVPVANAGTAVTIGGCGKSTTLDGSASTGGGVLTYAWLPAASLSNAAIANPVATPASNTTYTLTVTSSYGCSDDATVLVTVDVVPNAIAAADATIGSCAGQSATLDATTSTGTGINYSWTSTPAGFTSGAGSVSVNPGSTTTYNLTITDTYGCTDTDDQIVTVDAAPNAIAGADVTIGSCAGQSATLDATTSTGAGISYAWTSTPAGFNSLAGSVSVSPVSTTTYNLTITDTHGCTDTDDKLVTVDAAPVANAGSDASICAGNSGSLDASLSTGTGLAYAWTSTPAGYTSSAVGPTSVTPAASTVYHLVVTDDYSCTATDDIAITVVAGPVADAGSDASECSGNDVALDGSSSTNYTTLLWSTTTGGIFVNNGTTTPDYTPSAADITNGSVTITLTASGAVGSPCAASSNDVIITISPKPSTSSIFHF